jgi:two-component system response regulator AlgR
MTLKVLLVDDEPLARMRLRALLQAIAEPATEVVGEAGDAMQAQAALKAGPCDLILLDIRLPGQGGLQWAATLSALPQPPAIVFISAHAEHALRAFDLDAVDYLTKPVRAERLRAALERVLRRLPAGQPPGTLAAPAAAANPAEPVLVIGERNRLIRLPLAELLYLKAEHKYVSLRTATRELLVDESLAELEPRLGTGFVRIHRNAIVARHAVRALELRAAIDPEADDTPGWAVRVAPTGEWLAVSRRQVAAVRAALDERAAR